MKLHNIQHVHVWYDDMKLNLWKKLVQITKYKRERCQNLELLKKKRLNVKRWKRNNSQEPKAVCGFSQMAFSFSHFPQSYAQSWDNLCVFCGKPKKQQSQAMDNFCEKCLNMCITYKI